MSWSYRGIGKPFAIAKALDRLGETLTGESKAEFDSVKDALKTVVLANTEETVVEFDANGHGYVPADKPRYSSCQVTLRKIGPLVE